MKQLQEEEGDDDTFILMNFSLLSCFFVCNITPLIDFYYVYSGYQMILPFILLFYVLPVRSVSDPTFSHPLLMQSDFKALFTTTTTGVYNTITFSLQKSYTTPQAVVPNYLKQFAISSIQLTPSTQIEFELEISSITAASLQIYSGIVSTFEVMKVSYLVWQPSQFQFGSIPYEAIVPNVFTKSANSHTQFSQTGSRRTISYKSSYFPQQSRRDQSLVCIFINGIKVSTISSSFNVNVTLSKVTPASIAYDISLGADTSLSFIVLAILTWNQYAFIGTLYSYKNSVAFANDKMEGVLFDNDNDKFLTILGWSSLSMEKSLAFQFELTSTPLTDFYPTQLANIVPYNAFDVFEFSKISCTSDNLDTLTFKCKTNSEAFGCVTYDHIIKIPEVDYLFYYHISPEGKYLAGMSSENIYILEYNTVYGNYSIFQKIVVNDIILSFQMSSNWTYFAVNIQSEILVYALNNTYKVVARIDDLEGADMYSLNFQFSRDATFVIAEVNKVYHFYRLNFQTGTYQRNYTISKYASDPQPSTSYFYSIRGGEFVYIIYEYSDLDLTGQSFAWNNKQNKRIYEVNQEDFIEEHFAGMDFTRDETIQATFNQDHITIYNIDDEGKRSIHQVIDNQYFFSAKYQWARIKLSDDGLTLAFMGTVEFTRRIFLYTRENVSAEFTIKKHILFPGDFDYIYHSSLVVSHDGELIIANYKSGYMLLYYCSMTINESQILPNVAYNFSSPLVEQNEAIEEGSQTEDSNSDVTPGDDKQSTEALVIIGVIFGVVNFVVLIGVVVFVVKKFSALTHQPNSYEVNDANATISQIKSFPTSQNVPPQNFNQSQFKVSEEQPQRLKSSKKKRSRIQISEVESKEHLDQQSINV